MEMLEGELEKLWDEFYRLETSMEDVEGCLWCRDLYGEEGRDVAILKTKRWIVVHLVHKGRFPWSSTCPGVPISIVSIFHVRSLCFQSSSNVISKLPDGSLSHNWCCGCKISLEGNKSWESNIGESDNTGDEGKIAGRAITTWGGGMEKCFPVRLRNSSECSWRKKYSQYRNWMG
uniref:Uncharacterized protein n=1 Tax=Tanacetum cinerariifolium TaxID=118510 RepID=A0A699GVS0_TANCI|nr:hypothetical protein [Tanacetum cinerariifolium]